MAQKTFAPTAKQAKNLIAAAGGYEESNDPAPVFKGRMEGEGANAKWVSTGEPLTFRGMKVYSFDVRVSQISPITGAIRPDTLRILFPSPTRPKYEEVVPADDGLLETE